MSTYLIIYLVAAIQGYLLSLALFFSIKKNKKANLFLGGTIFTLSMHLFDVYLMNTGYNESWPRIPVDALYSFYLFPPLFHLFIKSSINLKFKWKKAYWWWLLPGFFDLLIHLTDYSYLLLMGEWLIPRVFIRTWLKLGEFVPLFWFGAVLLFSWRMLKNYQGQSDKIDQDEFKNSNFIWLKQMLGWGLVIWSFYFIIQSLEYIIVRPGFLEVGFLGDLYTGLLFVISAWIFTIGYLGYSRPDLFHRSFSSEKSDSMGFPSRNLSAFKKYTGQTPSEFRKKSHHTSKLSKV